MSKFLKITYIIINNAHITELINVVKTIISKQKQQTTILMKINMYTTVLQFKTAAAVTESFSVHKILICFTRKIIIKCFNVISENHAQSIA